MGGVFGRQFLRGVPSQTGAPGVFGAQGAFGAQALPGAAQDIRRKSQKNGDIREDLLGKMAQAGAPAPERPQPETGLTTLPGGAQIDTSLFGAVGFDPAAIEPDVGFASQFDLPAGAGEVDITNISQQGLTQGLEPLAEFLQEVPGFENVLANLAGSGGRFGVGLGPVGGQLTPEQLQLISTQIPGLSEAFQQSIARTSALGGLEGGFGEFQQGNLSALQSSFSNILRQLEERSLL